MKYLLKFLVCSLFFHVSDRFLNGWQIGNLHLSPVTQVCWWYFLKCFCYFGINVWLNCDDHDELTLKAVMLKGAALQLGWTCIYDVVIQMSDYFFIGPVVLCHQSYTIQLGSLTSFQFIRGQTSVILLLLLLLFLFC